MDTIYIIERIILGITAVILLVIAGVVGFRLYQEKVVIPEQKYANAEKLMQEQKYEEAITAYSELGEYKDSVDKINECNNMIQQIEEEKKAAEEAAEKRLKKKSYKIKLIHSIKL